MKRIILLLLTTFLSVHLAMGQLQSVVKCDSLTIYYNNGEIQIKNGEGELFQYSEKAPQQHYRNIYYLFTDCASVNISKKSRLKTRYYIKYDNTDAVNRWLINGRDSESPYINHNSITKEHICFVWETRAHLLFDVPSSGEHDPGRTVLLVVLPKPTVDTVISSFKLSHKWFNPFNDTMSANLHIQRTGRIVFDSFLVEGVKLKDIHYHGDTAHHRDTPYYRINGYADMKIRVHVPDTQQFFNVRVFYRYLNPNGFIQTRYEDISIPIYRGIFSYLPLIGYCLLAIVLIIIVIITFRNKIIPLIKSHKDETKNKKIAQLKEEISSLKKQLSEEQHRIHDRECSIVICREAIKEHEEKYRKTVDEYEKKVAQLESERKKASEKEYTSDDKKEFQSRCKEVIKLLCKLNEDLSSGRLSQSEATNKISEMEQIIFNKQR